MALLDLLVESHVSAVSPTFVIWAPVGIQAARPLSAAGAALLAARIDPWPNLSTLTNIFAGTEKVSNMSLLQRIWRMLFRGKTHPLTASLAV